MEFLLALVVLIVVASITKSVLWALVYIVGACIVLAVYRRARSNR
jgi:hypothetical protein